VTHKGHRPERQRRRFRLSFQSTHSQRRRYPCHQVLQARRCFAIQRDGVAVLRANQKLLRRLRAGTLLEPES